MRASLILLGSLCFFTVATATARADIGLNQTRGLDQDCFGSSSQNENFVSPTTGTVVVSINQNDNLNTWVQLFEGNNQLARADAGWDETRYDDGTVTQGVTYRLHQNTDWGSCGSQTMGIWGVSIASPSQNQAITGTTTPTYSGVAPVGLTVTVYEGATALEEGRQANRRVEFIIIDPPPPGRGHVVSDRCLAAD